VNEANVDLTVYQYSEARSEGYGVGRFDTHLSPISREICAKETMKMDNP